LAASGEYGSAPPPASLSEALQRCLGLPLRRSVQVFVHDSFKKREIDFDDVPYTVRVVGEISMRETVAEIHDRAPGDLRMALLHWLRELRNSIRQGLETTQYGLEKDLIAEHGITTRLSPTNKPLNAVSSVDQVFQIACH
jgi:hypothetical protein